MTKRKNTKHVLAMSVISLLLCVSMLIGTTFAWFTDSVTSAGNIIQSGTLKVTMKWADGTKAVPADDSDGWIDASEGAIFKSTLWEPGYTEVRHIKIANEGSLSLKYNVIIEANGEVGELADVIDVYYSDPAVKVADRATLNNLPAENYLGTLSEVLGRLTSTAYGELTAGDEDTITIALKMQESAGNHYQNMSIGNDFSVKVFATQLTNEMDSFDDQYDAGAFLPVIYTVEELREVIKDGGSFKVVGTMDGDETSLVYGDAYPNYTAEYVLGANDTTLIGGNYVLDTGAKYGIMVHPNNKTVTLSNAVIDSSLQWSVAADFENGGALIIMDTEIEASKGAGIYAWYEGDITLDNVKVNHLALDPAFATTTPWAATAVAASDGVDMTINSGTYVGATYGAYIYNSGGNLVINNGNFKAPVVLKADGGYSLEATPGNITVNGGTFDGKIERNNGYANIVINNGTFTNFAVDSQSWCLGGIEIKGGTFDADPTTWLAEGYVATRNADNTYTVNKKVVPDGTTLVSDGLYVDADGVYYITKAAGFDGMREKVEGGHEAHANDGTWILYNDIDMSGVDWTPINGFYGTFDGNNKTISNLIVNSEGKAGFFGENTKGGDSLVATPTIKNVTFEGAKITGNEYVGVVAADMGYGLIENVTVTGAVVNGNKYVAGIVGYAYRDGGITVTGCTVKGSTIKANNGNPDGKVGGISGFVALGTIKNNTVTGCTISGPECVGGILGRGGSGDNTTAVVIGNTVSDNTVTGTDTTTTGDLIGEKLNVKESE